MRITRRQLRNIIAEIAIPTNDRTHLTMGGDMVSFGCEDCVMDLDDRIADAMYSRDNCSIRSADRTHYNGILNLLRRDQRAAVKEFNRRTAEHAAEQIIGEGACDKASGHEGCIRKRANGWVVLSNKDGKCWGRQDNEGKCTYYDSEEAAKKAMGAYHA